MTEYDNTNSGALFKNKDKDDAHPNWADYNGSINVEGEEFWLSAWIKKSKKTGETFMSLSAKPKDGQRAPRPQSESTDDVPF